VVAERGYPGDEFPQRQSLVVAGARVLF